MAAPSFSTPFQPYVYQSAQAAVTPFQIIGGEAQIVQIMLKSHEKITAKPGTMCYMSGSIQMDNIYFPENEGGAWQWLFGKNVTSIVLSNAGADDGYVGIAAPSPARILPIDLANFGGEVLIQPDAFLCSINDVTIKNAVDLRARIFVSGPELELPYTYLGGREIIALPLEERTAIVGKCYQLSSSLKILDVGELVVVDVACILAMTGGIDFQLKGSIPVRRAMFGGEAQLTASLTGPGIVFIQGLPFHRLSRGIARAMAPPAMRESPKFFIQIVILFFLAYVMILTSLIFTDI